MNPEWPCSRVWSSNSKTHCPTTPDRETCQGKETGHRGAAEHRSHPQIKEYFQKIWRIRLPDTKEETLVELAKTTGRPEAANLLQNITECRHLHKRLNTYVNHLQDKHRRSDGRVHGQFNPIGTVGSRISAS